jgi:hypothetical protein
MDPRVIEQARVGMLPMEFASEYLCEFVENVAGVYAGLDIADLFDPSVLPLDPMERPLQVVRESEVV